MIYHRIINPDTKVEGYEEVFNLDVQRLTDLDGNTVNFPAYTLVEANASPAWALPDPAPPPPPDPIPQTVPEMVTKRQFMIQLLRSGMVDKSEVAALSTTPPALMASILASLPAGEALEARLSWSSMTQVERYSPLTLAAAAAAQITDQQLDEFFIAAAQI